MKRWGIAFDWGNNQLCHFKAKDEKSQTLPVRGNETARFEMRDLLQQMFGHLKGWRSD